MEFATTWIELAGIIFSKVSQKGKNRYRKLFIDVK